MMAVPNLAGVCCEALEFIVLFQNLENTCHHSQDISVFLSLESNSSDCDGCQPCHCHVRVEVVVSDLGHCFLEGRNFLKELCRGGAMKQLATAGQHHSTLKVVSRRIGDNANMSCFEVGRHATAIDGDGRDVGDGGGFPSISELVVQRPTTLQHNGLLVSILTHAESRACFDTEVGKFLQQLHLLHISNPKICFSLQVMPSEGSLQRYQFNREGYRSVPSSQHKLASSLVHYTELDRNTAKGKLGKFHFLKGATYTIPSVSLLNRREEGAQERQCVNLKVFCVASVVPSLPLKKGKMVPANRLCGSLYITVLGPGGITIVPSGSQADFLLSSLARWEEYGLEVGSPLGLSDTSGSTVVPSFAFALSNNRRQNLLHSALKRDRRLFLFLFVEGEGQGTGEEDELSDSNWITSMNFIRNLRDNFGSLVMRHSKKFQQAFHSVLNKLICNYETQEKANSTLESAISLLSCAMGSIVQKSNSGEFKRKAMTLLQINSAEEVKEDVYGKLWQTAREKYNMLPPSLTANHLPSEPISPEIYEADASLRPGGAEEEEEENETNEGATTGNEGDYFEETGAFLFSDEDTEAPPPVSSASSGTESRRVSVGGGGLKETPAAAAVSRVPAVQACLLGLRMGMSMGGRGAIPMGGFSTAGRSQAELVSEEEEGSFEALKDELMSEGTDSPDDDDGEDDEKEQCGSPLWCGAAGSRSVGTTSDHKMYSNSPSSTQTHRCDSHTVQVCGFSDLEFFSTTASDCPSTDFSDFNDWSDSSSKDTHCSGASPVQHSQTSSVPDASTLLGEKEEEREGEMEEGENLSSDMEWNTLASVCSTVCSQVSITQCTPNRSTALKSAQEEEKGKEGRREKEEEEEEEDDVLSSDTEWSALASTSCFSSPALPPTHCIGNTSGACCLPLSGSATKTTDATGTAAQAQTDTLVPCTDTLDQTELTASEEDFSW